MQCIYKIFNPLTDKYEFRNKDNNDELAFPENFDNCTGEFSTLGGIVPVANGNKWGFISETGAIVVPFMFSEEEIGLILDSSDNKVSNQSLSKSRVSCVGDLLMLNNKNPEKTFNNISMIYQLLSHDELRKGSKHQITDGVFVVKTNDGEFVFSDDKNRDLLPFYFEKDEMKSQLKNMFERDKKSSTEKPTTVVSSAIAYLRTAGNEKRLYQEYKKQYGG